MFSGLGWLDKKINIPSSRRFLISKDHLDPSCLKCLPWVPNSVCFEVQTVLMILFWHALDISSVHAYSRIFLDIRSVGSDSWCTLAVNRNSFISSQTTPGRARGLYDAHRTRILRVTFSWHMVRESGWNWARDRLIDCMRQWLASLFPYSRRIVFLQAVSKWSQHGWDA
jgi:hypothetical protein